MSSFFRRTVMLALVVVSFVGIPTLRARPALSTVGLYLLLLAVCWAGAVGQLSPGRLLRAV